MKKLYTKHFQYKGQMINYYNKMRENIEKYEFISCGLNIDEGYIVEYVFK